MRGPSECFRNGAFRGFLLFASGVKNYWCPAKLWREAGLKGQQANSPGQRPG